MNKNIFIFFCTLLLLTSCQPEDSDAGDFLPDPKEVWITHVKVHTMPLTDKGSRWDVDSDADLTFSILNHTDVLYSHPEYYLNIGIQSLPITIPLKNPYHLPAINQPYAIRLYDYDDLSPDDPIADVYFNPNEFKGQRPSSKKIETSNAQIEIFFTWQ